MGGGWGDVCLFVDSGFSGDGGFAGGDRRSPPRRRVFARTVRDLMAGWFSAGRTGRMSRKREPSLAMRTDQSRSLSPVTLVISPSPERESVRVSGFPWTMVKVMSWVEVIFSNVACAVTFAVAEKNNGGGVSVLSGTRMIRSCWAKREVARARRMVRAFILLSG